MPVCFNNATELIISGGIDKKNQDLGHMEKGSISSGKKSRGHHNRTGAAPEWIVSEWIICSSFSDVGFHSPNR